MRAKIDLSLLVNLITEEAKNDNITRLVVGGVIKNNDNKYLLLRRTATDFMGGLDELPSGEVENGENILSTLKREVKEEANLDVVLIDEYLGHFDYKSRSGATTRQFNFSVIVNDLSILKLSEEHQSYLWLSVSDFHNFNITPELREMFFNLVANDLINAAKENNINRFVVGGLITNENNEALLLKRATNDFLGGLIELPSGKVEVFESLIESLKREIKEETNLVVSSIDNYLGYFDYKSKSGANTRQFNFKVSVVNPNDFKISEEHESAYWLKYSEISNYNISDVIVKILSTYFDKK